MHDVACGYIYIYVVLPIRYIRVTNQGKETTIYNNLYCKILQDSHDSTRSIDLARPWIQRLCKAVRFWELGSWCAPFPRATRRRICARRAFAFHASLKKTSFFMICSICVSCWHAELTSLPPPRTEHNGASSDEGKNAGRRLNFNI